MDAANQIFVFLVCVLTGVASGVVYEVFYILRKLFPSAFSIAFDVAFFLVFAGMSIFASVCVSEFSGIYVSRKRFGVDIIFEKYPFNSCFFVETVL